MFRTVFAYGMLMIINDHFFALHLFLSHCPARYPYDGKFVNRFDMTIVWKSKTLDSISGIVIQGTSSQCTFPAADEKSGRAARRHNLEDGVTQR